jgi:glucose-1-phosphatase
MKRRSGINMERNLKQDKLRAVLFAAMLLFVFAAVLSAGAEETAQSLSHEGYTLEQAVILSRHNIRSPLSGGDSLLGTITPHKWFNWSSKPSELSLRGGVLETEMGEYFRKWLEAEGLFPENYHPDFPSVRIYANSKQRTIATAQYFTAGLLPTANMSIEYHVDFDTMDPVFTPQLTFISDVYKEYAEAQIRAMFTDKIKGLADNYALITDVIDLIDSKAFQNGNAGFFNVDDTEIILEKGAEPAMKGSLKTACSVSDALVLQYYEEPYARKAAFGHDLTIREWKEISEIKDVYGDVLFTAPLIATNVAHPLLQEIRSEMTADGRVFTFLCGHDSNLGSVLAALDVVEYDLPYAIENKTPIGSKLVLSKWLDADGNAFWSLDLVYQKPEQLRSLSLLDLKNPPAMFHFAFNGLEQNPDGLYPENELLEHFDQAIAAYDTLAEEFGAAEEEISTAETEVPVPAVALVD